MKESERGRGREKERREGEREQESKTSKNSNNNGISRLEAVALVACGSSYSVRNDVSSVVAVVSEEERYSIIE